MHSKIYPAMKRVPIWKSHKALSALKPIKSMATEVVIIGGGITGASAAYHLTKLGIQCILLEAEKMAAGASGKNLGTIVPGVEYDFIEAKRKFGENKAKILWKASIYAIYQMLEVVASNNIDCGMKRVGHLNVALDENELIALKREFSALKSAGFETEWVENLEEKFGAKKILGAERTPHDCVVIHPDLVRGLAAKAREAGAQIFENSKARIVHDEQGWRVITKFGEIRTKKVILATESMTDKKLLPLKMLKERTVAMATMPIKDEWFKNNWKGQEIIWNFGVEYDMFRKVGNQIIYCGRSTDTKSIFNRFFNFDKRVIKKSNQWSCKYGHFHDNLLRIGQIPGKRGLYFSGGYKGHGITFGFLGGQILAYTIAGKKHKYEGVLPFR